MFGWASKRFLQPLTKAWQLHTGVQEWGQRLPNVQCANGSQRELAGGVARITERQECQDNKARVGGGKRQVPGVWNCFQFLLIVFPRLPFL